MFAPVHHTPLAYLIIAAIVAVSISALRNPRLFDTWRMHPYSIYRGRRIRSILTSVFVHINEMHLLINSMLLCLALPEVEYMLVDDFGVINGRLLLLFFILFAALFVGMLTAIQYRKQRKHWSAGASALVMALVLFFLIYFPVEPIAGMPAFASDVLPLWIALVLLAALGILALLKDPAGAIHLYGALAGILLAFLIRPASMTEIIRNADFSVASEESNNKPTGDDHAADHADDGTAEESAFPAFTAFYSVRVMDRQTVHPLGDFQD
ncbi:rhomboid family intramembrane serine protease [Parapedobacter indicus]|uniref:Rhomboid family protein n=1 Tax=Parapedobacter indicus TaxID=1477437 RepID=A0A1I3UHA4_9SPHI|nr:rhomboid family intramembrane serine protease [Parapedobacter indicus]PPK99302.1 rhomboid family protein [Parapedobacter indicus]SFJ82235.1 Rhomboid family protein [Parapedobacter indicus]